MALVKTIVREGETLTPRIAEGVYMAENATVVGDVTVGEGCSLWFNAVLRGDVNTITIGKHCNIQDGVVLHTLYKKSTITLGDYVSVGHNVTIHGADVDNYALIGMGATLLDGCEIGEGAIVAAGALVLQNTKVGAGEIWGGVPAKYIKPTRPGQTDNAEHYVAYAKTFMEENPECRFTNE